MGYIFVISVGMGSLHCQKNGKICLWFRHLMHPDVPSAVIFLFLSVFIMVSYLF